MRDIAGLPLVLTCAVAALIAVTVTALRAWRQLRALLRSLDGADALVNVHTQQLDTRVAALGVASERLGADGERLAGATGALQVSLRELRFVAGVLRNDRERLRQLLVELALPTGDGWRRWRAGTRR